jgi:hypothetical protein
MKITCTENIPSLFMNDEKVKDPEVTADTFNTSFLTIPEYLNFHKKNTRWWHSFFHSNH